MITGVLAAIAFVASLFIFIAALGAVRFPDTLTRMAAISKSISLALVLLVVVAGLWFRSVDTGLKMGALVIFVLLTSPVSAHLMARSARGRAYPLSSRTRGREEWRRDSR